MEPKQCKSGLLGQIKAAFPIGKRPWATRALTALLLGGCLMVGGQALAHGDFHNQAFLSDNNTAPSFIPEASQQPNFPFVDLGVIDSLTGENKHEYPAWSKSDVEGLPAVSCRAGRVGAK